MRFPAAGRRDLGNLRAHGRLLWADSLKDIVNTNLIPLAVVLLARLRACGRPRYGGGSELERKTSRARSCK